MINKIPLSLEDLADIAGGATLKEIAAEFKRSLAAAKGSDSARKDAYLNYLKALKENYDSFSSEDQMHAHITIAALEDYLNINDEE